MPLLTELGNPLLTEAGGEFLLETESGGDGL